ncbi:MAG: hypothetical protein P1P87_12220 [Trueperaceae bacterium]|nr:hypothetical protein [Trueperaceae bacterium]
MHAIRSPNPEFDPMTLAASDDLYQYGRRLHVYVQGVLAVFRTTGDLALLDHVDEILETMRAELRDPWRDTEDRTDGTRDGYLNWAWRYSSGGEVYPGKDINKLDEMKTHAFVAMVAVALDTNRDLPSPSGRAYGAHADFWRSYLVDHFEAKWREREGVPSGFPIMTRPHMHTYLSWLKWHYYMGLLTGDPAYAVEASSMAEWFWGEIRLVDGDGGPAFAWPRSVLALGGGQDYLMPTTYATSVYADAVELHLEGFDRWARPEAPERFARTFVEFVVDSDDPITNGFASDVGGGRRRAGVRSDARAWPRMTPLGFAESGFPLVAAWDATGTIAELGRDVRALIGPDGGLMIEAGGFLNEVLNVPEP